jgi:hypothetical protein
MNCQRGANDDDDGSYQMLRPCDSIRIEVGAEVCRYWKSTCRLCEDRADLSNGPKTRGASVTSSSIGQCDNYLELERPLGAWMASSPRVGRCWGMTERDGDRMRPTARRSLV